MLVYNDSFSYKDPLNIVFLCGNKYSKDDEREKRNILKKFIESDTTCKVVILEENFVFARTNKRYLAYNEAFLNSLAQVEQLASLFANKIIIIHETISTAAELGMFAINPSLSKKICLLYPDDISIEEKKITQFIKLAFINREGSNTNIGSQIIYYPDVEVYRKSLNKSFYLTYFHNNQIGLKLGNNILDFIKSTSEDNRIYFEKIIYRKMYSNFDSIDFWVDNDSKSINAFINSKILRIQLLSLICVNEIKLELRKNKSITQHVTFVSNKYCEIIKNTICNIEGLVIDDFTLQIELKSSEICKLRQAVGFYIFMLQACKLIIMEQENSNSQNRKIIITTKLLNVANQLKGCIIEKKQTAFGRQEI
ncbi:MAG: hypothetical protein Q4F95_02760 [Oscillospiraceae bacterium]|nr:hypothetical protein [Oscillospiraceae bacterium]